MTSPVNIEGAEHYLWGDGCDGWHLVKREDLSVIQERVPPGKSERKHYHEKSRQFFFVLEGVATMEIEDKTLVLREHQGIEIPPMVPHQLHNESSSDLVFLVVSTPKSHGDRIDVP